MLRPENFYSVVVSSYEKLKDLGGVIEFQSNLPLSIKTIGAEGQGMYS